MINFRVAKSREKNCKARLVFTSFTSGNPRLEYFLKTLQRGKKTENAPKCKTNPKAQKHFFTLSPRLRRWRKINTIHQSIQKCVYILAGSEKYQFQIYYQLVWPASNITSENLSCQKPFPKIQWMLFPLYIYSYIIYILYMYVI